MVKNKKKPEQRNNELLNTISCTILVFWLLEYRLITNIMLKSIKKTWAQLQLDSKPKNLVTTR